MSRNNRTIIFSIHQPRYSIYKLFDNLLLLAKGNIVYQGACSDALGYLQNLGLLLLQKLLVINNLRAGKTSRTLVGFNSVFC